MATSVRLPVKMGGLGVRHLQVTIFVLAGTPYLSSISCEHRIAPEHHS